MCKMIKKSLHYGDEVNYILILKEFFNQIEYLHTLKHKNIL